MILIFATPEEARDLLGLSARQPEIVRPQTSGPCVHYDERSEHAADADPCTYPYGDGTCPHLDNPEILCPVKDACYAMHEVARMRDECEQEQGEQVCSLCGYYDERSEHVDNIDPCTHPDACEGGCPYLDDDGIYCPQKEELAWAWGDDLPEFVSLAQDPEGRGHDRGADVATEGPVYAPAEPEFVEPEPDEAAIRRPRFKAGDRVRISHQMFKGYTGTIRRYYAATENYLMHIDGTTDTMWISEDYLEAV